MEWMHVLADDEEEVREEELIGPSLPPPNQQSPQMGIGLDWIGLLGRWKGRGNKCGEKSREERRSISLPPSYSNELPMQSIYSLFNKHSIVRSV